MSYAAFAATTMLLLINNPIKASENSPSERGDEDPPGGCVL